jgi:hypothetical protein
VERELILRVCGRSLQWGSGANPPETIDIPLIEDIFFTAEMHLEIINNRSWKFKAIA